MNLSEYIGKYFRPGITLTIFSAVLAPVLVGLGFWQLARGADKAAHVAAADQPVLQINALGDLPHSTVGGVRVLLHGRFVDDADLLLDNQPLQGNPGLAVLTPVHLSGGGLVLTARAWMPARGHRRDFQKAVPPIVHTPDEAVLAELWPLPASLLDSSGAGEGWPKIVQKLDVEELQAWFGDSLAQGVAWRLPAVQTGPDHKRPAVPATPSQRMTPMRHYGYAVQWFALALTLLILYGWYGIVQAKGRAS